MDSHKLTASTYSSISKRMNYVDMRSEVEVDTVRFDLCMEKMADELVLPVKRCANFQQA